jgi:hypothetical protein
VRTGVHDLHLYLQSSVDRPTIGAGVATGSRAADLSAQRRAAQPRAAISVVSNHLGAPAPLVGCSGVLGGGTLLVSLPPAFS